MTTAHDNADLVRRGYEAFNGADLETLARVMAEDVVWHTPGRSPVAGPHQGRDATFAQFARYGGETGGTMKAALLDVFPDGEDRVVGLHRNTAERNGKHLDVTCCIVFQVRDGQVVEGREYFEDLYAWDDFWS